MLCPEERELFKDYIVKTLNRKLWGFIWRNSFCHLLQRSGYFCLQFKVRRKVASLPLLPCVIKIKPDVNFEEKTHRTIVWFHNRELSAQ